MIQVKSSAAGRRPAKLLVFLCCGVFSGNLQLLDWLWDCKFHSDWLWKLFLF